MKKVQNGLQNLPQNSSVTYIYNLPTERLPDPPAVTHWRGCIPLPHTGSLKSSRPREDFKAFKTLPSLPGGVLE